MILKNERDNRIPRQTYLENELNAELLDERYLFEKTPGYRKLLYRRLPVFIAQVLEALIIVRKYDVILSQTEKAALPLALMMRLLRMKTPHVAIISRITSFSEKQSKRKKWFLKHTKQSISRYLIWSSVQRQIAINELGIDPDRVVLIKRGVDQEFWKPDPEPSETDMICSVGMEARDYPTLVEALAPLDIPCHIAAGIVRGELFETIRKLYEIEELPAHITVGKKDEHDLREIYKRSRFTVVSLMETDSDNGLTTILETMAMGKPVICSRVEGQVDVIADGETGILVPQGDARALREAVVQLWNDPQRCREMGIEARKYIEKHHTLENFAARIREEVEKEYGAAIAAGIIEERVMPAV